MTHEASLLMQVGFASRVTLFDCPHFVRANRLDGVVR